MPAAVGLRAWQPPQAHMFVSNPVPVNNHSTAIRPHASVLPVSDSGQSRYRISPTETIGHQYRAPESPLKVRKTRENLRSGYLDDAAPVNTCSVPELSYTKSVHARLPPLEAQNAVLDAAGRDPSINPRFSWDADSFHLTTVIEQSPTKRTSAQPNKADPKPAPSLSRKQSVRKRVVSRVKDGLLNRSKSSSKVTAKDQEHVATSRSASEHERLLQAEVAQSLREEQSSTSQPSTLHMDQRSISGDMPEDIASLVNLLTESPVLGKTLLSSSDGSFPSPLQEPELSHSPSPEKTPRQARKPSEGSRIRFDITPRNITLLHVALSITPAWDTLDLADEATMWAMIKAEATISGGPIAFTAGTNDASTQQIGKCCQPLDIIAVIDNSYVSSQYSQNEGR
jgi:hypothetical protein